MNNISISYILQWISHTIQRAATEFASGQPGYAQGSIKSVTGPLLLLRSYKTDGGVFSSEESTRLQQLSEWSIEVSKNIYGVTAEHKQVAPYDTKYSLDDLK